jgi:putative transposase
MQRDRLEVAVGGCEFRESTASRFKKKTGKNPTDRGKIGTKRSILTEGQGVPISIVLGTANTPDHFLLKETLDSVVVKRPNPKRVRQNLLADKEYNDWVSRITALDYGYYDHIPQKKNAKFKIPRRPGRRKARRWVVEQTFGCLNRNREVMIRWLKSSENYEAILHFAAGILCFKRSHRISEK